MPYTVSQLARLAGVTPRTLRHYDAEGLLSPSAVGRNGYRYYEQADLLRLQQILFYRELDFPLVEIRRVLDRPSFDTLTSLKEQKRLLTQKRRGLDTVIRTIDKTIHAMQNNQPLSDKELYEGLSEQEIADRKREAQERWGHTDAYKQSQQRVAKFTREDWAQMKVEMTANVQALIALKRAGKQPSDPEVQAEVAKHHAGINRFYDVTPQIYRGLADTYVADDRFRMNYDQHEPGLAAFLAEGMRAFCNTTESES